MLEVVLNSMESVVAKLSAIVGVVALILVYLFRVFGLYERHWSRRRLRTLKELRSVEGLPGKLLRFVDDALYLEGYRIVSGIRASRAKVDFLLQVASTGSWTSWQIRQIARYIVVSSENPNPELRITRWETVGAYIMLVVGWGIFLLGIVLGVAVALKGGSLGTLLLGFALIFAYAVVGAVVRSGFDSYKVARMFGRYLENHPELLCAEEINGNDNPGHG